MPPLSAKRGGAGLTAIGIDIGGTNIRAGRVTRTGELLDWTSERTAADPALVVQQISRLASSLLRPEVVAIGIGIPGRVNAHTGAVLSGGYVNLAATGFVRAIETAVGKRVFIDNDCNMALVGETIVGAGFGHENVVMFSIGTGIGGAAVLDGKIVRGRQAAGQFGHLTIDLDGRVCACGRRGCIETTSSGTALRYHITQAGLPPETTLDWLFQQQATGNTVASDVLTAWARPLRAAIDSMVAAFDPDVVILGGGLGAEAHRAVSQFPAIAAWYQCPLKPAQLGDHAGVIGAGITAMIEHGSAVSSGLSMAP